MQSTYLYVVMWEEYDGYSCTGGDIFYSLDPDKANEFMHKYPNAQKLTWDEEEEMYIYRDGYAWEKLYVDMRPLNEEL